MNFRYMLPHSAKPLGWAICIPSLLLMLLNLHFGFVIQSFDYRKNVKTDELLPDNDFLFNLSYNNFTDEIGGALLLVGLMIIAFSKERHEGQGMSNLRLQSLQWAVLVNSIILMLCIFLFYDGAFLTIMAYNVFSTLILFIMRFNFLRHMEKDHNSNV